LLRYSRINKANEQWHFNTKPIRLKCPKCLLEAKNPRQVKVSKNIKSIVYHIAREHKGEYWTEEYKQHLKSISRDLSSGVIASG